MNRNVNFKLNDKNYSKTCVKWPLKIDKTKILMTKPNEGRKYCRILQEDCKPR